MKRQEKEIFVSELNKKIRNSKGAILVDFKGLKVEQINSLRRSFSKSGIEFKVTKNTLLRRAAKDTSFEKLEQYFVGPTAITFVNNDPVVPAKLLTEFIKDNPVLQIKAAILDDKVLDVSEVKRLGSLPPKEVLLAQLLFLMKYPQQSLVNILSEIQRKFLRVLLAIKENKEK
ncbi:MAG: 50S ribosomal protein L10 [Deltaproteobacteria bacterium]|nr:MAG: 50S ribosomal protein L10 [Deltaproteobacteria bacterium]